MSIGDTAKKLGEMWNSSSAEEKQPYERKASKLKEKYDKVGGRTSLVSSHVRSCDGSKPTLALHRTSLLIVQRARWSQSQLPQQTMTMRRRRRKKRERTRMMTTTTTTRPLRRKDLKFCLCHITLIYSIHHLETESQTEQDHVYI